MAMLTNFGKFNEAKDAGVVLLDKVTGEPIRKITFGDKKDPDYKLDELGRVVYCHSNGNKIQGFNF